MDAPKMDDSKKKVAKRRAKPDKDKSKESLVRIEIQMGSALLTEASKGNLDGVIDLANRGAVPYLTNWAGYTGMHYAAQLNHIGLLNWFLFEWRLNKNQQNKIGKTPLHLAAQEENLEIVKILLDQFCDLNRLDMFGMTPLHWAVEKENSEIVKLLVKAGANKEFMSKFGETPMSMALKKQNHDIIQLLNDDKMNLL